MARGPVVLFLPWPVLQNAIQLSRKHGLPAYRAMDLHFMRRAAAHILDAMRVGAESRRGTGVSLGS